MIFYLHDIVRRSLAVQLPTVTTERSRFDFFMRLQGEVFRCVFSRTTQQVRVGEKAYFIKQHQGIGWKEIFKNLFSARAPIFGAKQEWKALKKCAELGIAVPCVMGYGTCGLHPVYQQSFVLMEAIEHAMSLEQLTQNWHKQPPSFGLKHRLILEVARIAHTLHEAGINHRDFYICHFLLKQEALYLIDLHRAAIRKRLPLRWRVKDLAGLDFSSRDIGLTKRDKLRFVRAYGGAPLKEILQKEHALWEKVKKRGDQLYREHQPS